MRASDRFSTVSHVKQRLYLLRHGKSEDHDPAGDHGRRLAPRGEKQSRRIGELLSDLSREPDLVLCSSATRARMTAEAALQAGEWSCTIEFLDELYLAESGTVLREITERGGEVQTLLVCGHEPGLSALASRLLGRAPLDMPTGGLVRIDFQGEDWSAAREAAGVLHSFVRPAMLD